MFDEVLVDKDMVVLVAVSVHGLLQLQSKKFILLWA